jgi:hypothetical protein
VATDLDQIASKLDELLRRVRIIETMSFLQGEMTMSALDDLTAQVTATTTVEASILTLVAGLAAQLKAAGTDPAKLTALTAQLQASAQTLANAVAANTPAAA